MPEGGRKSRREFLCRERLWERFGTMASELRISRDELINDAMQAFAERRGHGLVGESGRLAAPAPHAEADHEAPTMPPRPPPLARESREGARTAVLHLFFNDQRFVISADEDFVIGRGRTGCHLTIRDENISRRHACVVYRDGGWHIQDLGSTNGIEYRGRRVDHRRIEDGDVFQICDYVLRFSATGR